MLEIPIAELPEHVLSSNRFVEFAELYPKSTHFMIHESCYPASLDPGTNIIEILNFDFIYGLSFENQVQFLINCYNCYYYDYYSLETPIFDSWLGIQLSALFKYNKHDIWYVCAKENYNELLEAIETIYGSPIDCGCNQTLLKEVITHNNSIMFYNCLYKYGFSVENVNMVQILNLNLFELFKIFVDYANKNRICLKFITQTSYFNRLLSKNMLHYMFPEINDVNSIYEYIHSVNVDTITSMLENMC